MVRSMLFAGSFGSGLLACGLAVAIAGRPDVENVAALFMYVLAYAVILFLSALLAAPRSYRPYLSKFCSALFMASLLYGVGAFPSANEQLAEVTVQFTAEGLAYISDRRDPKGAN